MESAKYSLPKDGGLNMEATPADFFHRYEKINASVFPTETEGVAYVADTIVSMIRNHDTSGSAGVFSLGLSTGRTPLGLYRELARRCEAGEVSFSNVAVYSLDELYPIKASAQQSRNYRIHEDFLSHIDIRPENIHIPDGTVPEKEASDYCKEYERSIDHIDLMVVGTGMQGQIGFNEPGSSEQSRTRLVKLTYATRESLSGMFHDFGDVPKMAITMGLGTIMKSRRIILMAWGDEKSSIVRKIVEGDISRQVPATALQNHDNIEIVVDDNAAQELTREQTPWLVGPCTWTRKFTRKAVAWLCGEVRKPILKLTYQDYIEHSLGQLVDSCGPYDKINIEVFNDLQHTITGWPGGKPNADDSTRPVPSAPYPKRVLIFSPHPDDDVISMGGTFLRLVDQGHDVHVAYHTSGNVAVYDDVVMQMVDTGRELGLGDRMKHVRELIASKKVGEPEPVELREIKASIRRAEARAACRLFGVDEDRNAHFLNMPFYETGGIKKGQLTQADIDIIIALLHEVKPHLIFAAGDLSDPHGTHRVCFDALIEAFHQVRDEDWYRDCHIWLYRGAWQEWGIDKIDMAVPLSPGEMLKKRHAIYRHLSQKDIIPFAGSDTREFWQRAEERTQNTASIYDSLGMAEYQAIEAFVNIK